MTMATPKPPRKRAATKSRRGVSGQLHEGVTGICDSYLRQAVAAVEGAIGPLRHFNAMQCVAAYVQSCAMLHASERVAEALNRNTKALKETASEKPGDSRVH